MLSQGSVSSGGGENDRNPVLRSRLSRASDLETKLSSLSSASSAGTNAASTEEKASKLRFQLCEILSDILLLDPAFAMRKDVPGRLWRGCFYGRIGDLRGRIAREKGRLRRAAAASKKNQQQQQQQMVEDLERNLKVFLEEAIVLYNYLVDKYEEMLVLSSSQSYSQSQSQSQTQESNASSKGGKQQRKNIKNRKKQSSVAPTPPPAPSSQSVDSIATHVPNGVVQNLHRFLIHLGDLHRYASSFSKAEEGYTRASRLAPGKGNPYNQLAVVAQLRDSPQGPLTAVALYWYARSLLASRDPFETSRANLARLFATNRVWLEDHGTVGDDVSMTDAAATNGSGGVNNGGKRAALERERAVKSALGRGFLAGFVDLHWEFFRGVSSTERNDDDDVLKSQMTTPQGVMNRIDTLIESLMSLLSSAAFGDALLCKLVSVNVFSAITAGTNNGSDAKDKKKTYVLVETSQFLAIAFTLRFGAALAEQVTRSVKKCTEKNSNTSLSAGSLSSSSLSSMQKARLGNNNNAPSLRLLSPLILLCDFISTLYEESSSDGAPLPFSQEKGKKDEGNVGASCVAAEASFWEAVASLVNTIRSSPAFAPDESEMNASRVNLKEYEILRGFAPFQRFVGSVSAPLSYSGGKVGRGSSISSEDDINKDKLEDDSVYVSPERAAIFLGLAEAKGGKGGGGAGAETRARIVRFLGFADQMVRHSSVGEEEHVVTYTLSKDSVTGIVSSLIVTNSDMDCSGKDPAADNHGDVIIEGPRGSYVEGMDVDQDDEDDDVVVYKASKSGGAALLVPGALFMGEKKIGVVENGERTFAAMAFDKDNAAPAKVAEAMVGAVDLGDLLKPGSLGSQAISMFPPAPEGRVENNVGIADSGGIDKKSSEKEIPLPQSQPPKQSPMVMPPPGFLGAASGLEQSSRLNPHEMNAAPQIAPFHPSNFTVGLVPPSERANSRAMPPPGASSANENVIGIIGGAPSNSLKEVPPPPPPGFQGHLHDMGMENSVNLNTANPFATYGQTLNGAHLQQQQQQQQQQANQHGQFSDATSGDTILPGLSTLFGPTPDRNLGPLLGFGNGPHGALAVSEKSFHWGSDSTSGNRFHNGSMEYNHNNSRILNYGIHMPEGDGLFPGIDGRSVSNGGHVVGSSMVNSISLDGFKAHVTDQGSPGSMVQGNIQHQHGSSGQLSSSQHYGNSAAQPPFNTSNPFFT